MPYEAGTAWLQVLPSFDNVTAAFDKEVERMGRKLDAAITQSINKGFGNGLGDSKNLGDKAGAEFGDRFSEVARKGMRQAGADLRDLGVDDARRGGDKAGGAYADSLNRALERGVRSIREIPINADSTDAEVKLAAIRRELEELHGTAHLDLDDAETIARIQDVRRRLAELSHDDSSVRVRVEAGEAAAELSTILGLEKEVDRADPTVKVKSEGDQAAIQTLKELTDAAGVTSSRLGFLIAIGGSLGAAIVPAAAAAAAAVGAIGTAAVAAGAGLGVAVLGFSGIGNVVQALDKFQNDAQKSAANLSQSQNRVEKSLDGVESAERSLANTRASAASGARRAAQTVVDAQRSIVDAQRFAKQAQEDLTRAYESARRAQEDQVLAIRDNALAQRQANLDIAEAKRNLDKVLANPRATEAEREQARITFEQKVLQLDELTVKQKRLQADQAAANRAGVEGSDQVRSAQERVRAATENVAKAQQRVADAIEAQKDQQRQAAFQTQQGQQAVVNAMRAAEQASVKAGIAGGAALNNLNWAMQQLGPTGQRFAKFLFGLKPAFLDIRNIAQQGLLPGVQQAITNLFPYLGRFRLFIGQVATALGDLAVKFVDGFKNPVWRQFFQLIANQTVPMLRDMFTISENVARGIASIILALSQFNQPIMAGLVRASQAFADWAQRLANTEGFQAFLRYTRQAAPAVLELLRQLGILLVHVVQAGAPIGLSVVRIITTLATALNKIPVAALTELVRLFVLWQTVLIGLAVVVKTVTVVMDAKKAVLLAWGFITDKASGAAARFRDTMQGTTKATTGFGFQLQAVEQTTRRTEESTSKLAGTMGRLRDTMTSIGSTATAGLARFSAAATTAGGTVSAPGRVGEVVSGAAQAALARYTTAITTAQGQISLLARTHEVASNVIGAAMGKVAAAHQAVVNVIGTEQNRYVTALTVQEGVARAFSRVQDLASAAVGRFTSAVSTAHRTFMDAVGTEQNRYVTALTVQEGAARTWAQVHDSVTSTITSAFGRFQQIGATATSRVAGAFQTATSAVGRFATSLGTGIVNAAGIAGRGLTGLVNALGGPWMIAITVATIAIGHFAQKALEQRQRIESLTQALMALGQAYRQNHDLTSQGVKDAILQNDLLTDLIRKTALYGLTVEQVARATAGDRTAQEQVVGALKARRDALEDLVAHERGAQGTYTKKGAQDKQQLDALNALIAGLDKQFGSLNRNDDAARKLAASQSDLGTQLDNVRKAFGNAGADAATFQAAIDAIGSSAFASQGGIDALGEAAFAGVSKLGAYAAIAGQVSASQLDAGQKADLFRSILNQLGTASETSGPTFDALASVFTTIANSALSASDKTDLLKRSLDQLYGSAISQSEADEALVATQDRLTTQLATNSAGFDLNSAKSGQNKDAILQNRDALEAALQTARDKYVQDIANGVAEDKARATHDTLTTSILNQIPPTQRNSAAVQDLVNRYGAIPPVAKTDIQTPGLGKAIDDLIMAHAVQLGLAAHPPWSKETIDSEYRSLHNAVSGRQASFADKLAMGGQVGGFSPTSTADNIPAWLTAGEWVQPVASVAYYGAEIMEAMRRRLIPRELLNPDLLKFMSRLVTPRPDVNPGDGSSGVRFAAGGPVSWPFTITPDVFMPVNLGDLWKQWEAARSGQWIGPLPKGVSEIQAWLRAQDGKPYVWAAAGPGGYDCSGLLSAAWLLAHGRNPYNHLFSTHDEAPYFPIPGFGVMTAAWANPGERGGGSVGHTRGDLAGLGFESTGTHVRIGHDLTPMGNFAHIGTFNYPNVGKALAAGGPAAGGRWRPKLYDSGGMLAPGWNPPIYNATGRPEPVLNQQQWASLSTVAQQGQMSGNTYNFAFKDTTLTPQKLRAMQAADAAYARVGRAR